MMSLRLPVLVALLVLLAPLASAFTLARVEDASYPASLMGDEPIGFKVRRVGSMG